MKFCSTLRYLLAIAFYISIATYAQDLRFEPLTQENVFDKQPVLTIAQDAQGKLWFGGENNLFVYDSQQVLNVAANDTIFSTLGYITKIAINAENHLFVATSTDFRIYDINKRMPIADHGVPFIRNLIVYDVRIFNKETFICASDGLYLAIFENNSYTIKRILPRPKVQTLESLGGGRFALASGKGVELIRIDDRRVTSVTDLHLPITNASERTIPCMYFDRKNLWIASKFHGLFRYDMVSKSWTNYTEKNSNLLSNNVRKIIHDNKGRLLIGTLKGLSIMHRTGSFDNFRHNALTPYSLSQNSIYDIFIDEQQIVWIGTYFGGINALYPNFIQLQHYSTRSSSTQRLNSDIVASFTESADTYWIGTEEEGISAMNKQTRQITSYPSWTTSNLIKDVYARHDKLYVAQYAGGYSVISPSTKSGTHFSLNESPFHPKNNIYSIYVDTSETIYLGTNLGLHRVLKGGTPQFLPELGNGPVTDIQEGHNQTIYALTNSQIYRKSKDEDIFRLDSLDKLSVDGFFIDADATLWFTSKESVYRRPTNGRFERVATFKGNTLGWPIAVENTLWITSKKGLIYYNLENKYTNILTEHDGLPVKNLQGAKIFLSKDQTIFVTTLNGLIAFRPEHLVFNKNVPSTILRNLWVNDQLLPFNRLSKDGNKNTYRLELRYDENFLTLDFSSSNFIKPAKNRFRYKLDGFDKDWIEISTPTIRYTNIPIGKHTLLVYASNNDMVWSKTPLHINIVVHPPFWKTWWAYLIYGLLFASIIHLLIKFIVEREVLINAEKEQKKKIKFFTQISHEIRTPLTLITAPLDEIIAETANDAKTQLKVKRIKKNANKLLGIINELLDFKKFDDKRQILQLTEVPLREYVEDNFYLLYELAHAKHLNYYIRKIDHVGLFPLDTLQFDKVLFNLLSNAIKYTPEGGSVYLDLLKNGDTIEIQIVDSGIGIAIDNQFKIFEEYYRENETANVIGTGIGLALTKHIVERHGGSISCRTVVENEQAWTIFTIVLNQTTWKELQEPGIDTHTQDQQLSVWRPGTPADDRQEVILIVEDNKELLDLIYRIFEENYTVIKASDGEQALRIAQSHLPDIIISDVMMPNMNGVEFCKNVKTNVTTSHIPFILLTAVSDNDLKTETLQFGANLYLQKPFDRNELYLSVINLLQISRNKRRNFIKHQMYGTNDLDFEFIHKLDELIDNHLCSEGFDVNFIAKSMGMSAPILYRKLKAITDLSLNNYVKIYRLNKAKQLLGTTMNISEVAYAVGFSDRKYFSKEFKKHFGINPSEFVHGDNSDNT